MTPEEKVAVQKVAADAAKQSQDEADANVAAALKEKASADKEAQKYGIEARAIDGSILSPSDSDTPDIKALKINSVTAIFSYVIWFLGLIVLVDIIIIGALLYHGSAGSATAVVIPDGLIAIGSAAVGAIAGMLAQPPSQVPTK
jgi:hypothetical protein